MKRVQLLCTFSTPSDYKNVVGELKNFYSLPDKTFFVFKNDKNDKEIMMTYNVEAKENLKKFPLTISIHRKKETNTLFTINSLNLIIKEENGGILDMKYEIDWPLYRNSLIITTETGYKVISLNLINTIKF